MEGPGLLHRSVSNNHDVHTPALELVGHVAQLRNLLLAE